MICDDRLGVNLPKPEMDLECENCQPGFYHEKVNNSNILKCVPCPSGTFLTETEVATQCRDCPAGTHSLSSITFNN